MQQQSSVRDGPNLQQDLHILTQNQDLICQRGDLGQHSAHQHSEAQTGGGAVDTCLQVPPLSREVCSRLQRTLEAGHRPLAVGWDPCRDSVQGQVSDTADESVTALRLNPHHVSDTSEGKSNFIYINMSQEL